MRDRGFSLVEMVISSPSIAGDGGGGLAAVPRPLRRRPPRGRGASSSSRSFRLAYSIGGALRRLHRDPLRAREDGGVWYAVYEDGNGNGVLLGRHHERARIA